MPLNDPTLVHWIDLDLLTRLGVAALLGFESQSALCRSFKQSFGMTTSQARRLVVAQPVRIGGRTGTGRAEQAIAA